MLLLRSGVGRNERTPDTVLPCKEGSFRSLRQAASAGDVTRLRADRACCNEIEQLLLREPTFSGRVLACPQCLEHHVGTRPCEQALERLYEPGLLYSAPAPCPLGGPAARILQALAEVTPSTAKASSGGVDARRAGLSVN